MGYIPTMILQPHRYPHIHNTSHHLDQRRHTSLLVPSSNLEQHSQLSLSQESLLQHPPVRSSSPLLILPESRQRSASLEVLSEQPHAQPAANSTSAATDISTSPTSPSHPPPPVITVKMDGEDEERVLSRSQTEDSEDSFMSDSTDFSFSDDSSFNSSLNLSPTANDEWLRLSRTPPPGTSNTLSPTSGPGGRLISSVSDPTLYKSPKIPKVPPRPGAQEILSRCTSVTRKNAAKGALSPKLRSSADKVPVWKVKLYFCHCWSDKSTEEQLFFCFRWLDEYVMAPVSSPLWPIDHLTCLVLFSILEALCCALYAYSLCRFHKRWLFCSFWLQEK